MPKISQWLLKTEPETYSFQDLIRDKSTNWNGVRNYQARNYLREMSRGDLALIYHSGKERAVIGIARVSKSAYTDATGQPDSNNWVQVDLVPVELLKNPVSLAQMKSLPELKELLLIKQGRLSVMPVTQLHFDTILQLAKD